MTKLYSLLLLILFLIGCGDTDTVTCTDICFSHHFQAYDMKDVNGFTICYCKDRDTGEIWPFVI